LSLSPMNGDRPDSLNENQREIFYLENLILDNEE
jgi:hypothetical protein